MPLRPSLALPWAAFLADWCLGAQPLFSEADVFDALETLERLLPEYLDRFEQQGKGLLYVHGAVHLGRILGASENLSGFGPVFERFKRREAAAFSELLFAAALVECGVRPTLEPALDGSRPDLSTVVESQTVFGEVVTPGRGDAIEEAQNHLASILQSIAGTVSGVAVELLLGATASLDSPASIAELVRSAPTTELVQEIPGVGLLLKQPPPPTPIISPRIPRAEPGPAIAVGSGRQDSGTVTTVAIRLPIDDERAQRVLGGERHHLRPEHSNMVFMDVTRVIGGIGSWTPLLKRCFQPTRNRRIGAVVLYEHGVIGPKWATWERWKVLRNPYARRPVPDTLLRLIEQLDDGPYADAIPAPPATPNGAA